LQRWDRREDTVKKTPMAVFGILVFGLLVFSGCAELLALEEAEGENTCGNGEETCSFDLNFEETPAPTPEETPDLNAGVAEPKEGLEVKITEFFIDKNTYASSEPVNAVLVVRSSEQVNGVKVKLLGVFVRGTYRVSVERKMDLAMGEKRVELNARTPYCTSGCGGVHPGEYEIKVEIEKGGEILAESSLKINLVKE